MYRIRTSKRFEKDFTRCSKRKYDLSLLEQVLELLVQEGKLAQKYRPHVLSGNLTCIIQVSLQNNDFMQVSPDLEKVRF
jgi:addiction module RelE/StbE family toxin